MSSKEEIIQKYLKKMLASGKRSDFEMYLGWALDEYIDESHDLIATNMFYSLCQELKEIGKRHEGERITKSNEGKRAKEIFKLTDLLEKEYNIFKP